MFVEQPLALPGSAKHMTSHPVENSYQCALCGKCFISWNNIQRHIKSHAWGQSISLCSVWPGTHLKKLQMKINTKPKENSYECALCEEGFISRNHLKRHMKWHALDNPYACALCVEEFISINHPKRHISSHSGKFHIILLFNIQEHFLQEKIFCLFNYCQKY